MRCKGIKKIGKNLHLDLKKFIFASNLCVKDDV